MTEEIKPMTTTTPGQMLAEFMTRYGAVIPAAPTTDVHPAVRDLRMDLLDGPHGEAGELREAMLAGDLPGIAAELADCLYVLWGTALTYGLGDVLPDVFRAVHEANMAKEVRRDVVPGDRKLVKGPGWRPADVAGILAGCRASPGIEKATPIPWNPAKNTNGNGSDLNG